MVQRSYLPLREREVERRSVVVGAEQLLAGKCGDNGKSSRSPSTEPSRGCLHMQRLAADSSLRCLRAQQPQLAVDREAALVGS